AAPNSCSVALPVPAGSWVWCSQSHDCSAIATPRLLRETIGRTACSTYRTADNVLLHRRPKAVRGKRKLEGPLSPAMSRTFSPRVPPEKGTHEHDCRSTQQ